ncbi:transglycosylase domain-containing protein [Mechercharimyces sp. CAU 1602]|uniref:transglycosylase domain-containing protein n=1 Tax=Mechercharimyces sp. CAU 1602 TaxID=2973933 RepID=UPI0021636B95|nr:PBP1A family penicillin-binding protein [Mechercharimyces sp. CAU 1602]MCS1350240.1 PBP1A family penicillin-binding protein [Mechercharimyces sp. CAU 1602]
MNRSSFSIKQGLKQLWKHSWWMRLFLVVLLLIMLFFLLLHGATLFLSVEKLEELNARPTKIYDKNGELATTISATNVKWVGYDQFPTHLVQAAVATEDQRFFYHSGVDVIGLVRATLTNMLAGEVEQGGSTITQQLVKNVILSHERTWERKAKEALYAYKVEQEYEKEEILELYLNSVYFGEGAWGIGQAAEIYFGKEVTKLSASESALLVGLLRAPSTLSPFKNDEAAIKRRNLVLDLMEKQGFLERAEVQTSKESELILQGKKLDAYEGKYPYYVDYILQEATARYGLTENEMLAGGYSIYTELDPRMQAAVEKVYANADHFPASTSDQLLQSGSVLMDPMSGGVRALVGGRGKHVFRGFNHATQLRRQPGSTLKPLAVYTPALEQGYSLYAPLKDEPINIGGYAPNNADGQYRGEVTMKEAVVHSYNIPAVWLLDQIGLQQGMNAVERFGIPLTAEDQRLGLALGGMQEGTSPLQMAQAYATFANKGVRVEAHAILRIEDKEGHILAKWYKKSIRVTTEQVAQEMTALLQGVIQEGTGEKAAIPGYALAGKTGSTEAPRGWSGDKDHWFVGYTPTLVGAVWLGYDQTDEKHVLSSSSSETATSLFREMMSDVLEGTKAQAFDQSLVTEQEPPQEQEREKEKEKMRDELEKTKEKLKKEWEKRKGKWEKELEDLWDKWNY